MKGLDSVVQGLIVPSSVVAAEGEADATGIDRRAFLKKVGLGSLALASLPALSHVLADSALAQDGTRTFQFVNIAAAGGTDLAVLGGAGTFGGGSVAGGGSFNHFNAATGAVIGSGTWVVRNGQRYTELAGWGVLRAGILVLGVDLMVEIPSAQTISGARLSIYCNLPVPNGNSGHPEGVRLDIPNGPSFVPLPAGAGGGSTFFSTGGRFA